MPKTTKENPTGDKKGKKTVKKENRDLKTRFILLKLR